MFRALMAWLLNSPDLVGGDLVGWRVVWAGSWSGAGLGLALAAAAAVSVLLYRRQDRVAGRRWQALLMGCRAAALAAVILLLCQPILRITKAGVVRGTCVILVDRTRSMTIVDRLGHQEVATALRALGVMPAAAGDAAKQAMPVSDDERRLLESLSRFALVKRAVAAQAPAFLDALDERFAVEIMTFGSRLEAVRAAPADGRTGEDDRPALRRAFADLDAPDGEITPIGAALRGLLERLRGQPLAGVILLTDGANNAGEDPRVVAVYAGRLGVPIYPVGVGAAQARDLHLAHILGEDVVFKDDLMPLTVRIRSTGCVGRKVTLVLSAGEGPNERVLKVKPDVVITGDGVQTEEIQFVPEHDGRMQLNVRIEPLPDEQNQANNARSKIVRVTSKKIRVLYVESRPRWEYRFLRQAMQRDRRVQPTFLLQEADSETAVTAEGLGSDAGDTPPEFIRTFPERREDLFAYDLILFGDVNVGYLTQAHLRDVAEFVEAGGGFGLIAGSVERPERLVSTPLGPVLPVRFQPGAAAAGGRRGFEQEIYQPLTQGYRPRLTPVGRSHPATRLAATVEESERRWSERPEFFWFCPSVARLQPAAQVLLEHPTMRTRFGPLPLVVVQPYGQGKSMFVGFDEVWRWRLEEGDRDFYRFYGQLIQFLGLSHLLGESRRIQVTVDRREVSVGEPVTVFARVLDESFKPEVAEQVTAVVCRAPRGSGASPADREVARVTLLAEEGAPGTYRGEFVPPEVGEYTIGIHTGADGEGEGLTTVAATEPRLEFEQASRNQDLLRALADLSGGTLVELDGLAHLAEAIERQQRAEPVHLDLPLWDSWLALVAVVVLLGVEWFIRKRVRLA